MARPQRIKRRYGLPWSGYQSSAPPHMATPDKATSDGASATRRSLNYRYAPLEGKFYRRDGTEIKGSTTGILENGTGELTGARCRQMLSVKSPSFTDGYPSHGSLWTEEVAGSEKGCLHFYSTNGTPSEHVLGQEFGTTQYPTALGSPSYMKALPYIRTSDNTIGRFNTLALRAIQAAGSRRMAEASDQILMGCLNGVPQRWDRRFNETNADTGDSWHVWHTGHPSPLGAMAVAVGATDATGSWHEGDLFYISCAYKFADGSVSMPIIPRDPNADLNYNAATNMSGWHKVTLARSGGFTDRYLVITWSGIPVGPKDCVGRFLLRTPKNPGKNGATGNDATDPAPLDLRITAYIGNNTDTTYTDPNGNDLSLVTDPLIVRFDHIMQPPARYMGAMDGRVLAAYTKPNPVAIYLAPHVNAGESDTLLDNIAYEYTLTGGTLTLYKDAGTTALANIGDDNIQTLVDRINNTVAAGGGGKWIACVAPGADAGAFMDAALLSTANTNLVSVTAGVETGDTSGRIRSYASSYYAPIFFSSTYLANFPTAKGRVFFTAGGPGMPTMAANSWVAANYRTGQDSWGEVMGIGALRGGAVVCFSNGIATLENRRGGSSGLDEDYRLYELNAVRGCIAWNSVTEYNGIVGYLTRDGYVITDGKEEVVISGDVWNPATQTGEWAYEIGQCSEAAASDTDIARFCAKIMGGRLYIGYALTGSARAAATDEPPAHWIVYDFTGSVQFSGLRGMLRPDGQPWGWSTPQTVSAGTAIHLGAMAEVVTSSGPVRYCASESLTFVGSTSNGRIFNIETGLSDSGAAVACSLWTARDFVDHIKKKSIQEARVIYKKAGVGLSVAVYRDGLGTTADASISLPTTSSNNFSRLTVPLPQLARASTDSFEVLFSESTAASLTDIWGFEADVLLLDSY